MNNEPTPPPLPTPSASQSTISAAAAHKWTFQPIEGRINFAAVIENLLRSPGRILHEAAGGSLRTLLMLLVVAVFCLGVFGLLLGAFSGGAQLWAAPAKVVIGSCAAIFICLPSLYIFSALAGLEASLRLILALAVAAMALTAVLLMGFAPVLWVFNQSTESLPFMGFLALAFWIISLAFGMRMLHSASAALKARSARYLTIWILMFMMVTLQMSTSLRPIIGKAETVLPSQKKFFVTHWLDELNAAAKSNPAAK